MDGISQKIESFQYAIVQELTSGAHPLFPLQYAELTTIDSFPSILAMFCDEENT